MVQSTLYVLDQTGASWKNLGSRDAPPKSRPGDHAERKLYDSYSAQIASSSVSAFIQNGAPCESCHDAFLKYSVQKTFIFAIGKMGSGKLQGGTGYPILPQTNVIPTFINRDGEEQVSTAARYVLKLPAFLDPTALPALIYYIKGQCFIGGAPEGLQSLDPALLDLLLNAAS
ncbi:hypothetical protein [Sphingomonas morindae]|uniref:Cytochrome c domain-containing protein n=1 Tax=Sphingomonas morindae TaxID=1541170 RepID=A0ABY4X7R5_9SPHN|nr:hypothetical protein [Sphingomonas morindae]USI72967.1 hypothetical protein LHA26_00355 [Sphingomonas morindae]